MNRSHIPYLVTFIGSIAPPVLNASPECGYDIFRSRY